VKQSVAWHRECLKNSSSYHAAFRKRLEEDARQLDRDQAEDKFLAYQIECAERERKDGFDAEKYKANDRKVRV
jgi:hypothetical protein